MTPFRCPHILYREEALWDSCVRRLPMGNKRWLVLGTGLLLMLQSSNLRTRAADLPERLLRTFDGHTGAVNNVVFSPDNGRLGRSCPRPSPPRAAFTRSRQKGC
jgi:hypothetical protein